MYHGWLVDRLPVVFAHRIMQGLHFIFIRKWGYPTWLWYLHICSKNTCTVTQRATWYKQRLFNACRTPVDNVTQNQPCINVERSSIMSQSGWKQPPSSPHPYSSSPLLFPPFNSPKKPSEGNRCAFIPRTEIAPIRLRLYEGPPSKSKSLTSNLQQRNQNVSLLCNCQADESGFFFPLYIFILLVSSSRVVQWSSFLQYNLKVLI